MRKLIKRIIAGAMALGLAATMMPGLSMTARAAENDVRLTVTGASNATVKGGTVTLTPGTQATVTGGTTPYIITCTPEPGYTYEDLDTTTEKATASNQTTDGSSPVTTGITKVENVTGDNFVVRITSFGETRQTAGTGTVSLALPNATHKKYNVKYEAESGGEELSNTTVTITSPNGTAIPPYNVVKDATHGTNYAIDATAQTGYEIEKITYSIEGNASKQNVDATSNPTIAGNDIVGPITVKLLITKLVNVKATVDDATANVEVTAKVPANEDDLKTGDTDVKVSKDYAFTVDYATGHSANDTIIEEVQYLPADGTGAAQNPATALDSAWKTLGTGKGEYVLTSAVMKTFNAGEEIPIRVKAVEAVKITFVNNVAPGVKITSGNSKYPVKDNKEMVIPKDEEVEITVDTPIKKKFVTNTAAVTGMDGDDDPAETDSVEITPVAASVTTTFSFRAKAKDTGDYNDDPTAVTGQTANTYTIDGTLEDYPTDPRKPKDPGMDGVSSGTDPTNGTGNDGVNTGDNGGTTPGTPSDTGTGFADDDQIADYAKPYIKAAVDANIIKGVGNNRFDPKGSATRSAFATMIQRAKGLKASKTTSRFADVTADLGEDLLNGVIACEDLDPAIVQGYEDGSFQPRKAISRAEGILMIWRAAGKPAYSGANKFTDLASWYAEAANWGADQGIVNGVGGGRFDGGATLTRQDLATMLGRAIEKGIIKPAADTATDAATDETKTDEKADDSKTDETKTDEAADGEKTDEAAEGEKTEA